LAPGCATRGGTPHALLELAGGLLREGDGGDAAWLDALTQEVDDPSHEYEGFARAGSGSEGE